MSNFVESYIFTCLHKYGIIIFIRIGGVFINNNSIDTRLFVTPQGVFYEGQVLYRYLWSNGKLYYEDEVILEKFIFHYKTGRPKLYCRFFLKDSSRKTRNHYTVSSEQLGILYKICKF